MPVSDIHETKDGLEVTVERDVLEVSGSVDFSGYERLEPLYTEYALGRFTRSFLLANAIDRDGIPARIEGGVLRLTLAQDEGGDAAARGGALAAGLRRASRPTEREIGRST